MKILAIETSCDETAVAYLVAEGDAAAAVFTVRGNALYSQAKKHAAFGGVYPSLAKREHAANLVPLLDDALTKAGQKLDGRHTFTEADRIFLTKLLAREERLAESLMRYLATVEKPDVDAVAVTRGPGLEPALWVGVNFARALAYVWDLPIIPVNHLEGHIVASAVATSPDRPYLYRMDDVTFPVLGLVLSGGHTEFVHAPTWGSYEVVGATRDDSIGEAFDKVARLLGLAYPGGPELSRLADKGRALLPRTMPKGADALPRPMLNSGDLDFSFSGLKTAVLYRVRDMGELTDDARMRFATEFEEAVTDVVAAKTAAALERYPAQTFALGGGVSANAHIRARLQKWFAEHAPETVLRLPAEGLSTDNALMIGMAAYLMHTRGEPTFRATDDLRADGNLSMSTR